MTAVSVYLKSSSVVKGAHGRDDGLGMNLGVQLDDEAECVRFVRGIMTVVVSIECG